jgi:hypothetical protein
MIKKLILFIFFCIATFLAITLFMYNQRYRMDLFGDQGKKGMKFEITLPQIGQYEIVEVKEGEGKETLRGIKNALITNKTISSNGNIVYDISYRQDEFGRRLVDYSSEASKFILWFGGGDLYGMGVSRENSMPQIFSKISPEYRSYNYGFAGIGAGYPLRILETTSLKREVNEKSGYMIYVLSEAHYPKTLGRFLHIYRPEMPHYKLLNGKASYAGTFKETEPFTYWIKMIFGNSWLRRMLGDMNDYTSYSEEEHKLVCEILSKTKTEFVRQFNDSQFILFLHTNLPEIERKKLTICAQEKKIPYVDTYMEYDESKFDSDVVDGHPTGHLNILLIEKLNEFLKTNQLI